MCRSNVIISDPDRNNTLVVEQQQCFKDSFCTMSFGLSTTLPPLEIRVILYNSTKILVPPFGPRKKMVPPFEYPKISGPHPPKNKQPSCPLKMIAPSYNFRVDWFGLDLALVLFWTKFGVNNTHVPSHQFLPALWLSVSCPLLQRSHIGGPPLWGQIWESLIFNYNPNSARLALKLV